MEIIIPKKLTAKEKQSIKAVIALLNTDAYFHRYYEIVSGEMGATQAWEALENELFDLCGHHRYTDYNSFREMRRRYVKNIELRKKTAQ